MKNLKLFIGGATTQAAFTGLLYLILGVSENTLGISIVWLMVIGLYFVSRWKNPKKRLTGKDYMFCGGGAAIFLIVQTFFV